MGLHRISLVRASGETFGTCVFDALEGTRGGCVLGEPIRRRPVLPGPATPPCAAPTRAARGMSGFWIRQVPNLRKLGMLRAILGWGLMGSTLMGSFKI